MNVKSMKWRHLWLGSVATLAVLLHAPSSGLGDQGQTDAKAAYTRYCSACHGVDAKGNGPLAEDLKTKPTDLTQIAKNAGGEFPAMKVAQSIDGSTAVRGHGPADMPVWGERFSTESAAPMAPPHATPRSGQAPTLEDRLAARGKILLITEYLRSVQAK